MTWADLFRRLWRAIRLRFRDFHECPECGVPMQRDGYRVIGGKILWNYRCFEDNCTRGIANLTGPPVGPQNIPVRVLSRRDVEKLRHVFERRYIGPPQ